MSCCPCCCENKKLSIYCKTCGQNVCKHCFLTCRKCYDRFYIDCEDRDFLCVDCLGEEEKLFHKLKQAENVLKRCDKGAEEDETESAESVNEEGLDYSLYNPRELCDEIENLKYKLNVSVKLSKEKDIQMEILREKIRLLEEQNTLLKEQLNKKLN